jgi:hypothetical protein
MGGLCRLEVRNPNRKSLLILGLVDNTFAQRTCDRGEAGGGRGTGFEPSPRSPTALQIASPRLPPDGGPRPAAATVEGARTPDRTKSPVLFNRTAMTNRADSGPSGSAAKGYLLVSPPW